MAKYKKFFKKVKQLWGFVKIFLEPQWRKLSLLVALGFLLRLVVYGYVRLPWIIFDEFIYLDTARQIIRGDFVTHLSRDPRLYPPGYPIILAAFTGFIKNPFLQYQTGLWLNMLLSALMVVPAFWLTGSLLASLALTLYPPLFVYSSSLMSESLFILLLLLLLAMLKYIVKDDFNSRKHLLLAGLVFGFLIFYTRMVRSFGVILLPAFTLATVVVAYAQYRQGSINRLKNLLFFFVLTVFFYYGFSYLGKLWFLPQNGYYEKNQYLKAIVQALKQPRFSFVLLKNEITLSLFWLLWVLPVFSVIAAIKEYHKKEWTLLLPRVFAWFIYLFSLGLTFAHMFIGTDKNPQYLLFSRYLDPALVLLFVYGVADLSKYLFSTTRIKVPIWVFVVIGYFVYYFVFKLPKLDYKFGNTMSTYFFLLFEKNNFYNLLLILSSIFLFFAFYFHRKHWLLNGLLLFFLLASVLAINSTLKTPQWVMDKYRLVINDWQQALNRYPTQDMPICIYSSTISSEVYYLYHFLNPYQYLRSCKSYQFKPKRILIKNNNRSVLPANCSYDFRFASGEAIVYCPLGY